MARDKLEEARREGMAYALNIVKTKGIGGLEEECKFRGATSAITLRDQFGFGAERIKRYVDRFNSKAECIMDDYTTWDEQTQILKEECGLEFKIRQNDKDVKVR